MSGGSVASSGDVEVRLPGPLSDDAGGLRLIRVGVKGPTTLGDVLDVVAGDHPSLGRRLRDETGALRRHVNVFVGEEDVRWSGGVAAPVRPGDVVLVLPSVAGG